MACGCSMGLSSTPRKYLKESYENNKCTNNDYLSGSNIAYIVILSIIFIYLLYLFYSKY